MLWLSLNIFFILSARAENYYIQTIGIDELDPKQNYTQFYQDAQGFEKYCSINTDIKCKLYLDQDPKRLLKPELYAETLKPIKGKYEAHVQH